MDTIFINTENSKMNEPHRFRLYLTDKLDLRSRKTVASFPIYYTWENINSKYNISKFKISGPTWSETFDLTDRSYEISGIQDYFLKMIQKPEPTIETNENSPILICLNGVENRISFKIKTEYKLELLTDKTQILLGDGPIIDKDKVS